MIETFLIESKFIKAKNIRIYLPANYSDADQHYPVLYMHDGKNVFSDDVAIGGVSLSLEKYLVTNSIELIVVGIDASEEQDGRSDEYCPWMGGEYSRQVSEAALYQGGKGDAYVRFIVEELKPFIDESYRTIPTDTAIGGISLGGLISTYAACKYPGIFKKVIAISSGFWRNQEKMEELIASIDLSGNERFYMDWGTKEGKENAFISRLFCESNESIANLIKDKIPHAHIAIIAQAEHSYPYFKQRVPAIFNYLLNKSPVGGN
ncbi:alpha/beta hydrolase [Chungangia koreensis]|uniref:Alpha/beta hydrolase n=1 Tax=Chungangia koreensis TaxID=752657 RepID=A0ABV8X7X3_9LACT